MSARFVAAGILLNLAFGTAVARPPASLIDDGGFGVGTPSADALARYRAAADYSRRRNGVALLVVEGDTVVFESYAQGYDASRAHTIWSGTKSFACALAVAAQADGLLALDEPVAKTLPEIAAHPVARAMTIRDLLAFTSGLDDDGKVLIDDFVKSRQTVRDKVRWTLDRIPQLQLSQPGKQFTYVPSHHMVLAAVLEKKLGEDPVAWLDRRVLTPIGFRYTRWLHDPAGHPAFAFGVDTSARSWARFGLLVRDDGLFRGQRVLPAGALATCFRGSAAMPAYGLNWWLNEPVPADRRLLVPRALAGFADEGPVLLPDGPRDIVAAAGYKDQRLYVIPSRNLVVVRFGRGHPRFEDPVLLGLLLDN